MDFMILVVTMAVALSMVVGGMFVTLKVSTREIPDNQRAALFRGGEFQKLAGPGKVMVLPLVDRAIPLAIGDVGEALVEGRAQFGGADVPIRSSAHLDTGDPVRIVGFDREQAAVVLKL